MSISDAFSDGYETLFSKISSILPFYLLGMGSLFVARSLPLIGFIISFAILESQGKIDRVQEKFEAVGPVENLEEWEQRAEEVGLDDAIADLFSTEVLVVMGLSFLAAIILFVAVSSLASSGKINVIYSCLTGGKPVRDGVRGGLSDFTSFFALALLEGVLFIGVTALFFFWASGIATSNIAVAVLLIVPWLISVLLIHLFFLFAPQAVVIDSVGALGALRKNIGFITNNLADFIAYIVIAAGVFFGGGIINTLLSGVSLSNLSSLIMFLVLVPFLDIVKTSLYHGWVQERDGFAGSRARTDTASQTLQPPQTGRQPSETRPDQPTETGHPTDTGRQPSETRPDQPTEQPPQTETTQPEDQLGDPIEGLGTEGVRSIRERVPAAFKSGWSELSSFVTTTPYSLYFLGSLIVFFATFYVGFNVDLSALTDLFEGIQREQFQVLGQNPIFIFVFIAVNNLTIGVSMLYSGVLFGIPTLVILVQNGFVIGLIVGAQNLGGGELIALLGPHGIIEIPALAISSALGIHLGVVGWKYVRNSIGIEKVSEEFERSYRIVLGITVLFVVAAFIEVFVTLLIVRPFVA